MLQKFMEILIAPDLIKQSICLSADRMEQIKTKHVVITGNTSEFFRRTRKQSCTPDQVLQSQHKACSDGTGEFFKIISKYL